METKRKSFLARATMTLSGARRVATMLLVTLLLTMTAQTAWADTWPEYIKDIILVGGSSSEAEAAKNAHKDYTFIMKDLNDNAGGDYIYLGYKKDNRANYLNGGYITNFYISNSKNSNGYIDYDGKRYYLCPTNSGFDGDLNDGAGGDYIYLYYTKENFPDKRVVSDISFNDNSSNAVGLEGASGGYNLNDGAGGDKIYMHLTTNTKTNRPSSDPVKASNLIYDGTAKQLITTAATLANGTMYYRIGTSGEWKTSISQLTATNAGDYTVQYYASSNSYSNASSTHSTTVSIAKSPNSGVTVSCADIVEGNVPSPSVTNNLSTGAISYTYSTDGSTYSSTVPTAIGNYWVKATIAADENCDAYTTAAVNFWILVDANDLWDVKGGADGTEAHPFCISNPTGLDLLASKVNGGTDYENTFFELGDDIAYDPDVENNYTAIGCNIDVDTYRYFKGHFDGKGHTVSGIHISNADASYLGLFGAIGSSAEVKNVILANSTFAGKNCIGGIAGHIRSGTVQNCRVESTVSILAAKEGGSEIGGITGFNRSGSVKGCVSAAVVSRFGWSGHYFGGIVGYNISGSVKDCLYIGSTVTTSTIDSYTGAIVGRQYNTCTHTNCYHTVINLNGLGGNNSNQDGVRYAVVTSSKPSSFGDVTATYGEGDYIGIKAYGTNGLEYDGKYYYYDADLVVVTNQGTTNATTITDNNGETRNVVLQGRTLYKDGKWNTLCLPFDVTIASSPLSGDNVVAMTLDNSTSALSGSTLTLNFTTATNTTIPAGTPFIIKWDGDGSNNLVNPVFMGVTISNANRDVTSTDGKVSFKGTYAYQAFDSEDKSILLVGGSNLYWPQSGASLGACRAYFKLSAGASASEFVLNFGDETTGIRPTPDPSLNNGGEWYDLSGRKLTQKPTQKGVYIHGGRKVVVK